MDTADIAHHLHADCDGSGRATKEAKSLLTHLRSRWTIEALAKDKTEVRLALEYTFANPLYTSLSAGAAPKVAHVMIKAFEERVESLLNANPGMVKASLADLEGSRVRS